MPILMPFDIYGAGGMDRFTTEEAWILAQRILKSCEEGERHLEESRNAAKEAEKVLESLKKI